MPGIDDWLADCFGAVIVACIFSVIRKQQIALMQNCTDCPRK
jgi:hypothetical protein